MQSSSVGATYLSPNDLPGNHLNRFKAPLSLAHRYLFRVIAGQANGARTLVRRKVGWRWRLEISRREFAVQGFLRDKSRAPGHFLAGALNRYSQRMRERNQRERAGVTVVKPANSTVFR